MKAWGAITVALFLIARPSVVVGNPIHLSAGAVIVAEGDSLTYGQDTTPTGTGRPINGASQRRSATPYPESLQRLLGSAVTVINEGYPGDRSAEGITRWSGAPKPALTVIMYGTNDAMNFGQHASGSVSLAQFELNLAALVDRARRRGGRVILLTPPPIGSPPADATVEPYRAAVRRLASEMGLTLIDTGRAITTVKAPWTDSVHLKAAAYLAIARAVAADIRVR